VLLNAVASFKNAGGKLGGGMRGESTAKLTSSVVTGSLNVSCSGSVATDANRAWPVMIALSAMFVIS
jgi:hypothetical protein